MTDKALDCLSLSVRKITESILNLLEVGHIRKQLLGIHQILVHIIEIRQDDLSPENELIKTLRIHSGIRIMCREDLHIGMIQLQQLCDTIHCSHAAHPVKEIINCMHLRSNDRLFRTFHRFAKIF